MASCPKCGYVRRASDLAPAWQCPGCGIAYRKYEAYLDRLKQDLAPRTTRTGPAPVTSDGSIVALVAANLVTLIVAGVMGWQLAGLMVVYWIQSVCIGVSYFYRMLALERFSTEDFLINDRKVEPTRQTQRKVAVFFCFHYGTFHLVYAGFLLTGEFGELVFGWDLLLCAAVFALNHMYSYRYNRDLDRAGTPNIGTMMGTPYVRIVPMHLTIIFGALLGGAGLLLFGVLKTVADVVMHRIEHQRLGTRQ